MKKIMILASLALLVGIYSFQRPEVEVKESKEEETASLKKVKRVVASIPSQTTNSPVYNFSDNQQSSVADSEPVNCLNYDGDDICQNEYTAQETFPEETYASTDSEVIAPDEQSMQELEEPSTTDFERDANENALFAANPIQSEE